MERLCLAALTRTWRSNGGSAQNSEGGEHGRLGNGAADGGAGARH
jgi:hypothetical protein